MFADMKLFVVINQKKIFYVDNADHIIRIILINRDTGVFFFSENVKQFLVSGFHINKSHVDPGHHDILSQGIPEIKHIVNHLFLFGLNNALLMAHLHDGAQLILCDHLLSFIGIHLHEHQHAQ